MITSWIVAARPAASSPSHYVDVVALQNLTDTQAPGAIDALLKRVVAVIGEQLHTFDLIIRLSEDEFLCAMSS